MRIPILAFLAIIISFFLLPSCGDPRTDEPPTQPGDPLVVIPPQNPQYPDTLPADTGMMQVIYMMIEKMQNVKMTTDFDLDFTKAMIIHHQAVVDLSQMEITKGSDKEMRDMALDIMSKNSAEAKKLEDALHQHKHKSETTEKHMELQDAMMKMFVKLKSTSLGSNIDKNYIMLMIPLHEFTIDVCTQEVINGHHVQLKLLSRDMLREKKEVISKMNQWLASH